MGIFNTIYGVFLILYLILYLSFIIPVFAYIVKKKSALLFPESAPACSGRIHGDSCGFKRLSDGIRGSLAGKLGGAS